jgi:hypothetical protein
MTTVQHLRELPAATRLKLAASALLALPAAVLLLFGIGEMAAGDISGVQHLPEAAALLLLLVAGWRYPRRAGLTLLGVGALLFALWLIFVLADGDPSPEGFAILAWVAAGLILFAPPIVAGWLLLKASR